jgi:hypothetical protein
MADKTGAFLGKEDYYSWIFQSPITTSLIATIYNCQTSFFVKTPKTILRYTPKHSFAMVGWDYNYFQTNWGVPIYPIAEAVEEARLLL